MQCPSCSSTLNIAERAGVEIDYCPNCRGIWLDRGELDKIIERTRGGGGGGQQPYQDDQQESWWERILDVIT